MAFLSTAGMIYFFIKSNEILSLGGTALWAAAIGRDLLELHRERKNKAFANKIPMNA